MSPSLCVCLLFHVLVGGALGKTRDVGGDGGRSMEEERRGVAMEEFMEEIRQAMSSQWEILQNIRFHTLMTKVRVTQLEEQVKKLTSQVEDTTQASQLLHTGSEEPPATGRKPPCPGEGDGGVMLLVEAMKDLASAYNRLLNSTRVEPGQVTAIAQDFGILTNIVHKMNNVSGTPSSADGLTPTTTTLATTTYLDMVPVQGQGGQDGSGPRILAKYSPNVTVEVGGNATLNCRFSNLTNIAVSWARSRDSQILAVGRHTLTDNRFRSDLEPGVHDYRLHIKSVRKRDEGAYECLTSTVPIVSHRIWLSVEDVQDLEEPSILADYSNNVTAEMGRTATLNCRVSNLGDASVFWYRDRDLSVMSVGTSTYTSDTRVQAVNDEELGDWQLKISEVQPSDEGWYDCVLMSPTHVSHKVWLSVVAATPSPDADLGDASGGNVFTVMEGDTATLACRVTDLGDATVSWTRSSGLELLTAGKYGLSPDPRFTAVQRGENWLLQIGQVQKQDAGAYECHVSTLPPTLYTFWLQVEESESLQPEMALRDVRTVQGKDVTLTCRVTSHPRSIITWIKDSISLASNRHQVMQDGDLVIRCKAAADSDLQLKVDWLVNGELVNVENELRLERRANNALVVKWVVEGDSGLYTCRASTRLDAVSASATLTVRGKGSQPSPADKPIAATTSAAAAADHLCPPPYEAAEGDLCVLQVTDLRYSWLNALEYCRAAGAELASEPGIAALKVFLKERYSPGGDSWLQWPFWVGGREEVGGGGRWRWAADGTLVDPGVWATGHPRPYGPTRAPDGSCMTLDGYHGYDASALPCHLRRRFLCRLQ